MFPLLCLLVINAFFILGLYEASQPHMILHFLRVWVKKLPEPMRKPLIECPTCMASVHSTYIYWFVYTLSLENIGYYIIYVIALAGLSFFINSQVPE